MICTLSACTAGQHATSPPPPSGGDRPATVGTPFAYTLYTHCGISAARISGSWFQADTPRSDGNGNPPPGWGNPFQPGTMRLRAPAIAEFRDDRGHQVTFHAMPITWAPPLCS